MSVLWLNNTLPAACLLVYAAPLLCTPNHTPPATVNTMAKAKKIDGWNDLIEDEANPNKGSERGSYLLRRSLERTGAGRSIVVDGEGRIIAGNKTAEAAHEKGLKLRVVQTDGNELVVVQRTDLDLTDDTGRARELSVADNRVGQVSLDWDADVMAELAAGGTMLEEYFHSNELEKLVGADDDIGLDVGGDAGSAGHLDDNVTDVKSVQLYYDPSNYEAFMAAVEHFRGEHQCDNVSDTVLAVLVDLHARATS